MTELFRPTAEHPLSIAPERSMVQASPPASGATEGFSFLLALECKSETKLLPILTLLCFFWQQVHRSMVELMAEEHTSNIFQQPVEAM